MVLINREVGWQPGKQCHPRVNTSESARRWGVVASEWVRFVSPAREGLAAELEAEGFTWCLI